MDDPSTWRLHAGKHPDDLRKMAPAWDRLAERAGSPFLTTGWLCACWPSAARRGLVLLLSDASGKLRAGGYWHQLAFGRLYSVTDVHTSDWDVVATDDAARTELWRRVAQMGASRVETARLPAGGPSGEVAQAALSTAGYEVVVYPDSPSPYLDLPTKWEDLLASTSRNLRSQLGRKRRALERTGRVECRTAAAGTLERDFETFLRLEASGWKGRAGTAIISRRGTDRLYRNAARGFADAGWLRLQLLEVDGTAIAGDLSCSFAEAFHMIKTAFDERHAAASPGLLMRAESLRSAVEEGARRYEFLGAPDPYKIRWGAQLRERAALGAYRGAWRALPVYRRNVRPVLKTVRDSARDWAKRVAPGRRD